MSYTFIIIIITALVSYKCFSDRILFSKMLFNPYIIKHNNEWYRALTHGLVHADTTHLLFNLLVLYLFGEIVEDRFVHYFGFKGKLYFVLLYVGALIASGIKSYVQHQNNPAYSAVGASGAVSALVFAFILIYPTQKIGLFFIPPFIPGWLFGILYLFYSQLMAKKQIDNIGHDAHFWGAVFGLLFTLSLRPQFFTEMLTQITQ